MTREPLLFLSQRIPYPPDKGDKIRAFHLLRHLAHRYDIHLGSFFDDPEDALHVAFLENICSSVFAHYQSPLRLHARAAKALVTGASFSQSCYADAHMRRWIERIVTEHEISKAFVFCSSMSPYLMRRRMHKILDLVDVDSEKWLNYAEASSWPFKWVYGREARKLLSLERAAASSYSRCFFVSAAEAELFVSRAPETIGNVGVLRNGVDTEYFDPDRVYPSPFAHTRKAIVFTGRMDYRPNVQAVEFFAREVFPIVRAREPKAQFCIVGAAPAGSVRKLADGDAVIVTGRVDDVRPFLAHAACVVAPLRIARGVQNKVLEALAMRCSVVATPQSNAGIDAADGQHLMIAESAAAFGDAVITLLSTPRPELGIEGRAFVQELFSWQREFGILDSVFAANGGAVCGA
jgi:sugar transferase (PEP-CTERM/EpsH1 system associated)